MSPKGSKTLVDQFHFQMKTFLESKWSVLVEKTTNFSGFLVLSFEDDAIGSLVDDSEDFVLVHVR